MRKSDLHVIVGLGATGLSCAHHLKKRGIPFAVTDTRLHPPYLDALQSAYPDVPVALGKLDDLLLNKAATIILSPGIASSEPAITKQIERGVPVIGDIELFSQAVKAPVIAITGTNAKSTVTTLVGKMAQAAGLTVAVGGNLGTPALDLLANHPAANLFVLELSSFQLETTYTLKSQVATILNVTPDHMDRYADFAAYQQTKQRIYQHCRLAVCNYDEPLTECHALPYAHKHYFTVNTPKQHTFGLLMQNGQKYLAYEHTPLLAVQALPVAGKHYQANALASLAIGYAFGVPMNAMLEVLSEFKGLPHRCQFIRERLGVKWYNDSKGTNVGATQAAISGLGSEITGKLILIMGGVGKNADFSPLLPSIKQYARHVVLIGEAAHDLAEVIAKNIPFDFAKTLDEAVEKAAQAAAPSASAPTSPIKT